MIERELFEDIDAGELKSTEEISMMLFGEELFNEDSSDDGILSDSNDLYVASQIVIQAGLAISTYDFNTYKDSILQLLNGISEAHNSGQEAAVDMLLKITKQFVAGGIQCQNL